MAYSPDPDEAFDYLFKIVLIGDAGVGKTCVVQRFKSGTYTEKHGSTIGVDFTMKTLNIDGKLVKVITDLISVCVYVVFFSLQRIRNRDNSECRFALKKKAYARTFSI